MKIFVVYLNDLMQQHQQMKIMNHSNYKEFNERQGEEIRSYIRQLNTWLREDLDAHLKQRLDFSTKAIVKLVRVFDKYVFLLKFLFNKLFICISLSDKYQRIFTSINSPSTGESNSNEMNKTILERNGDLERENDRIQRLNTTLQSRIHEITLRVNDYYFFEKYLNCFFYL